MYSTGAKAKILETRADGAKLCRCYWCGIDFVVRPGGYWQNHFYCSGNCCHGRQQQLLAQESESDDA
jgi:hypothetical protein